MPSSCVSPQTSTLSTFDSKHRLVARTVSVGRTAVQRQTSTYPPVQQSPVPGNYARPLSTTVTYLAASSTAGITTATTAKGGAAGGGRSTTETRTYDDHGRVLSSTDATGTSTVTTYDPSFGLVTGSTVTGRDGSRRQTSNVLTADQKSIQGSTTGYAAPGQPVRARSTTSYRYDTLGQPSQRIMTWAPGAKPSGNSGGPDSVTTTFAGSVDTSAHTRTITTTTAAGTTAAGSTKTVLDLVTGQPVRDVDALGRVTSYTYDAGARQVSVTTPDGLTTRRAYTRATSSTPATQTDSTPDGRVVLTTFDALGRNVRVTDNVRNQAFTATPTTRQLSTFSYSVDGTKITGTDQLGRTTTTTMDALGRQVQQVGATGVTKATGYDDVAHTTAQSTIGAGSGISAVTRTTTYDDGNRPVSITRRYSDGDPSPNQAKSYDGLGRVTSLSSDDLTMAKSYLAPGGTSTDQQVTPQAPKSFPSSPLDLSQTEALGGQQTDSERESGTVSGPGNGNGKGNGKGAVSAAQGTKLTYDAAGRLATSTDPDGRTTTWSFYTDGKVATRVSPTGTVTRDVYDATTGRLSSVTAQPPGQSAITTTYTYVPAGQLGAGQVHSMVEGTSSVTLAYDADHHVVSRSYSDGTSTSAAYLDDGLHASTTDVTGAVTSYGYDRLGRITSAIQKRGTTVLASVGYTYDGFSRIATTTRSNKVTTVNSYNAHNQLTGQTTTSATGSVLASHAYTYDTHGNVATRVDTVPTVSATPATAGTWTSAYGYDAYDRLVGSATYAGGTTAGQPTTSTTYTLNVAGDIVGSSTTTRTQNGAQRQDPPGKGDKDDQPGKKPKPPKPPTSSPTPFTTTVTNMIDAAGQLTGQSTDGTVVNQAFDGDGRVTKSLTGTAMTYDAFDRMATATTTTGTAAGTSSAYAYWPDGTRRSTTTTGTAGASTQTFHYGADGTLVNDTTADATTGSGTTGNGTTTASYLLTAGREARTLQPGTTPTGTLPAGAPAAVVTGVGTGYVLRDRHSSVTALVDATGAVTDSYEYADYGAAAQQDGQTLATSSVVAGGRANPFRYTGAAPTSSMTDPVTGLLLLKARSYDPAQARFTSRDTANVFNHYQGFSTNPIRLVDITGHAASPDLLLDIAMAVVFLIAAVAAVFTAGSALAAALPLVAPLVTSDAEISAGVVSLIVGTAAKVTAAAAALTGAGASVTLAANDIDQSVDHKSFLSKDLQKTLGIVEYAAGAVSVVSGLVAVGLPGAIVQTELDVTEAAEQIGGEEEFGASTENDEPGYERYRRDEEGPVAQTDPWSWSKSGNEAGSNPKPDAWITQKPLIEHVAGSDLGLDLGDEAVINEPDQLQYGPRLRPDNLVSRSVLQTDDVNISDQNFLSRDSGLNRTMNVSRETMGSVAERQPEIPIRPLRSAAVGNWSAYQAPAPYEGWVKEVLSYDDAGAGESDNE
jgi:RHS repeat-associated protein